MGRRVRMILLGAALTFGLAVSPSVTFGQTPCQRGTSGGGGIDVHDTATGTVTWCSPQAIEDNGDFSSANDPIQANPHSPSANPVANALSIHSLLTLAGINPADLSFAYIVRSSGTWSTLGHADLQDPSPSFSGGNVPAIRIDDGDETEYMRPLRNPSDDNAADNVIGVAGQALALYVHTGPLLTVSATAGDRHPGIGEAVKFSAAVSPATAGITYSWSFGDGASARGASPSHVYTTTGLYSALVTVKGAGNSGGASPPIQIQVGKARSTPTGKRAGGGTGSRGPRDGSSKQTNQSGAGTTRTRAGHGRVTKTRSGQGAGHDSSAAASGLAGQAPPSSASPPATSPPPATSLPPAATTSAKSAPAPRKRTTAHRRASPADSPVAAPLVDGRLIAGLIPVAPERLVSRSQAPAIIQPPAARAPGPGRPLAAVLGGCVIILLLGSGAGQEWVARRRSLTSTSGR